MTRRPSGSALKLVFLTALFAPFALAAQSVALTFDDGPEMADAVRMTAAERNAALLQHLRGAGIKSALFLTLKDAKPDRLALVRQWGLEGHRVGNHTVTHPNFHSSRTTLAAFQQELIDCDEAIRSLPGYFKRFRFPFLKEGNTLEKRDGFRTFLRSQNYRNAPVSIDTSDWFYNSLLQKKLKAEPAAQLESIRRAYLVHINDRASYYDDLAVKATGRSIKHVLLLHHNLINALFLGDIAAQFKARGWLLIDAEEAFTDPAYESQPDVLPAGEGIVYALAKQKGLGGLRYPAEDGRYEEGAAKKLGP